MCKIIIEQWIGKEAFMFDERESNFYSTLSSVTHQSVFLIPLDVLLPYFLLEK